MAEKQRKMVNIDQKEVSGVDMPAHLTPGWCVIKSATADQIEGIFGKPITKESVVASEVEGTEEVTISKAELDAKDAEIATLKADLEKAAVVEPIVEETPEEAFMKSAPEAVRKQFEALQESVRKSEEKVEIEKAARLDAEVITKSKVLYKNLGMNHDTVAPALRRIEELNPELAKELETVLAAADAQLAESGLFGEVGTTVAPVGDAEAQLNAVADDLVTKGLVKTHAQGIAKALEQNPALYDTYVAEKAGK